MKKGFIALALLVILPCTVSAQDTISGYLRLTPANHTAGYDTGFALGADVYSKITSRVYVDVDVYHEWAAKTYVGDGRSFKVIPTGLFKVYDSFLIGGGIQYGRQWTSQYEKDQLIPLAALHYNPRREVDAYFEYLFRDQATYGNGQSNNVQGWRTGYKAVIPLSGKWGVYVRGQYQRWSFTQPTGPDAGKHYVNTFSSSLGVSRLIK